MAASEAQAKKVETSVEEVEKTKAEEKPVVEEKATENGDSENGSEEKESNGKEVEETKNGDSTTEDVCKIKRKSTGGDAKDESVTDGATPEKKAKLDEPAAEAESNGEAEVAA